MLPRVLSLAFLSLLIACVSFQPPDPYAEAPDRVYGAAFSDVWQAVLETFTDSEMPIENLDKVSGFLRSGFMPLPSDHDPGDLMDCGRAVNPHGESLPVTSLPDFRPTARITVLAHALSDNRTRVRLRSLMRGTRGFGLQVVEYECESTGKFEQTFFEEFERRIAGGEKS